VLESDEDIVGHDIRYQRSILNTSIFTIEPHAVLCGIFQDITKPIFQKEQIIGRAREVIQKNLKTVQQIAYLLGENAADSEIISTPSCARSAPKKWMTTMPGGRNECGGESFIEVDYCQRAKHGQLISGDVFLSEKVKQEGRIVSVLSDGLGSGVKASVLASHDRDHGSEVRRQRDGHSQIGRNHHGYPAHLQRAQDQLFHFHRRRHGQHRRDAHHRTRQSVILADPAQWRAEH
jgi:hypothetical protein